MGGIDEEGGGGFVGIGESVVAGGLEAEGSEAEVFGGGGVEAGEGGRDIGEGGVGLCCGGRGEKEGGGGGIGRFGFVGDGSGRVLADGDVGCGDLRDDGGDGVEGDFGNWTSDAVEVAEGNRGSIGAADTRGGGFSEGLAGGGGGSGGFDSGGGGGDFSGAVADSGGGGGGVTVGGSGAGRGEGGDGEVGGAVGGTGGG